MDIRTGIQNSKILRETWKRKASEAYLLEKKKSHIWGLFSVQGDTTLYRALAPDLTHKK